MNCRSAIVAFALLALGHVSMIMAQSDEVMLDTPQTKITTVSAMRARKSPQVSATEVTRLKLGTIVNAVARSASEDTVAGKSDYWYRVNLPTGESGWVFGGLLLNYNAGRRSEVLRHIIEARLKAENTDFSDRMEIYNLAASSINEAKDATRAPSLSYLNCSHSRERLRLFQRLEMISRFIANGSKRITEKSLRMSLPAGTTCGRMCSGSWRRSITRCRRRSDCVGSRGE